LEVALAERNHSGEALTHHAEIILIEGESYRKRETKLTHKKRRDPREPRGRPR
jgi:hypothetical protein